MMPTSGPSVVLTIAATDSGGGAGIAADLTTIAHLGAHGACVVTAVTAQDTLGVRGIHAVPLPVIATQLDAVLEDLHVSAVKTGMLGTADVVALVADRIGPRRIPLVVDPVLKASTGATLAGQAVVAGYRSRLLPIATVVTPNISEARTLVGEDRTPRELAEAIAARGPAVVLTGGTTAGTCTDWIAMSGKRAVPLRHAAVETENDHGTGCTFSAALAVHLARGATVVDGARSAASFTTTQLEQGLSWTLGRGRGPIAHTMRRPR